MSFKLKGDFAKLKKWVSKIEGTPGVLKVINENLAEEAIDLIKEGFVDQQDPYGNAWKPKKRPDGRNILTGRTGRLKGGWHRTRVSQRGFTIAPSVDYATFHQEGTRKMVARRMFPTRRLPPKWRKRFVAVAVEILKDHFEK